MQSSLIDCNTILTQFHRVMFHFVTMVTDLEKFVCYNIDGVRSLINIELII